MSTTFGEILKISFICDYLDDREYILSVVDEISNVRLLELNPEFLKQMCDDRYDTYESNVVPGDYYSARERFVKEIYTEILSCMCASLNEKIETVEDSQFLLNKDLLLEILDTIKGYDTILVYHAYYYGPDFVCTVRETTRRYKFSFRKRSIFYDDRVVAIFLEGGMKVDELSMKMILLSNTISPGFIHKLIDVWDTTPSDIQSAFFPIDCNYSEYLGSAEDIALFQEKITVLLKYSVEPRLKDFIREGVSRIKYPHCVEILCTLKQCGIDLRQHISLSSLLRSPGTDTEFFRYTLKEIGPGSLDDDRQYMCEDDTYKLSKMNEKIDIMIEAGYSERSIIEFLTALICRWEI